MSDLSKCLLLLCSFSCIEVAPSASAAALAALFFAPVLRDWAKK